VEMDNLGFHDFFIINLFISLTEESNSSSSSSEL